MEIVFIKEAESSVNILAQLKNKLIDRIQRAVKLTDKSVMSLILPIVPTGIKLPRTAEINKYNGIEQPYTIPNYKNLETISWSSFFPVNKSYSFQHGGSVLDGYEYVDFIDERLKNQLPMRMIAYDLPKLAVSSLADTITGAISSRNIVRVMYDHFVNVENFDYSLDKAGDLQYSITLKEFNEEIADSIADNLKTDVMVSLTGFTNQVTRQALIVSGLI